MIPYCVKAHGLQSYGHNYDGKYYCVDSKARLRWRPVVDPRRRRVATPTLVLGPRNGVVLYDSGPLVTKLYVTP